MQAIRRSAHCVDSNRAKWHIFTTPPPPSSSSYKGISASQILIIFLDSFASKDVSVAVAVA